MDKYITLLKNNNLKITHHRLEVLKFLDDHRTHPTADEIYSFLKKKNPSLSKTTIYNTLEILKKHNLINALTISGSELRYDLREQMHHHFLCRKCGMIIDIELKCPNIDEASKYGCKVEEVHGYFKGLCKKCIN